VKISFFNLLFHLDKLLLLQLFSTWLWHCTTGRCKG